MSTQPRVLAGSIGECCIKGVKHTGDPVGRTETIAGVETYVSDPPTSYSGPKRVVLYFADVHGPFLINAKLLQDYFASRGFHAVGLDYFFGDPIQNHDGEEGWDVMVWVNKARKVADEVVPRWIDAVREKYGADADYSAVGYCFGAPYVMDILNTDKVVAGAFAHPAFLNEDHFRNIKKPLLLSCSEVDMTFPTEERRRAEDILAEIKATYHVQIFSGVVHGFATRGDPEIENTRWAKEESARSIIEWFIRFSKK
ncbi:hypothetical protein CVT24_010246 [Panaeolus cyanescens]|uniref:Dienelactone hydrolase domain-containing protein n=1 Tax=Panaeolus cyanescens TaxID=181874 RepID=A0A409WML4_9AGAR|nr:hypothetical protein CVT24_010246 [Panaeolus cyanescens]